MKSGYTEDEKYKEINQSYVKLIELFVDYISYVGQCHHYNMKKKERNEKEKKKKKLFITKKIIKRKVEIKVKN